MRLRKTPGQFSSIRIPPRRAATYYNRGMCYKAKGNFGHAVADITKSLQDGGDNTDAYEERGAAYAAQHNYKQAIADYTKAYQRDARHTLALSGRAQCYLALNDYQRAVADYDQFARAEAGHAESWGTLAWAQYLAGRIPDAIANNQKALRMNPRLTFVEFNLGLCYATQGNWASAQKEYRSVLGRAQTGEVKMGLQDVRDALRKHPTTAALKQAETLLAKTAR